MISAKDFGIQVMRASGDEEYCLCPFHDDHSSSASFNRRKGVFYCYVCGVGYNVNQLQQKLGINIELESSYNLGEPDDYDLVSEPVDFDLGEAVYVPYFEERRIPKRIVNEYGVRWKDGHRPAAVLPIPDLFGKVQGVAYRYLFGATRYQVQGKPTAVWPLPLLAKVAMHTPLVIVEGAWSAMRLAAAGLPAAPLALLGAKANLATVNLLHNFRVTFLYDGDAAGERACRKMRRLFPTANSWTVSTSPDDMDDRQMNQLILTLITKGAIE